MGSYLDFQRGMRYTFGEFSNFNAMHFGVIFGHDMQKRMGSFFPPLLAVSCFGRHLAAKVADDK